MNTPSATPLSLLALAEAVRQLKAFGGNGGLDVEERLQQMLQQIETAKASTPPPAEILLAQRDLLRAHLQSALEFIAMYTGDRIPMKLSLEVQRELSTGLAAVKSPASPLIDSLRFYAKEENWKDVETGIGCFPGDAIDGGARAREALEAAGL